MIIATHFAIGLGFFSLVLAIVLNLLNEVDLKSFVFNLRIRATTVSTVVGVYYLKSLTKPTTRDLY